MTDPSHDDLRALDERAHAAARGLHEHVLARVDADASLHDLGRAPSSRGRLLAVAAAVLLITGTVAVAGQRDDVGRSRVELGEPLDVDPGVLRPLGPRDGKDSVQLPITVEPSTGLVDGDVVTVTGSGFQPGEQVGIVQCAREAGGETPEARGGVDGCYIGEVQYADADDQGNISGTYTVRRALTTPLTGTVDCAAEAERCIVGAGALSDYDRSGGMAVTFAPAEGTIDVPELSVSPATGLAHGDVVTVTGSGFEPRAYLDLQVCSSDPSACWHTGDASASERGDEEAGHLGLVADDDGRVEVDVPVWRFLPGTEPATYVDCATSACSLRATSTRAPAPVPLAFEPGGDPPTPPAVAVAPTDGLAPGDEVTVQGEGFEPGAEVHISLCASPTGEPTMRHTCAGSDTAPHRADDEGTFAVRWEVPDLGEHLGPTTTLCDGGVCRDESTGEPMGGCGDDGVECAIVVETFLTSASPGPWVAPPQWQPEPVVVTFR